MRFKRQHKGYVWCDHHGEVHQAIRNIYGESVYFIGCIPENWRRVWIETNDPDEWFTEDDTPKRSRRA